MKRLLAMLLALCFCLGFAACGGPESADDAVKIPDEESGDTAPEPAEEAEALLSAPYADMLKSTFEAETGLYLSL